jgi:hypothetical protein
VGAGAKVRRHGKVHELPADVREQVDALLLEPDITYEDVEAFLKEKGHDISTSSIGRYGKHFLNQVRKLRQIEDQARTLVSEAGADAMVLEEAATKLFAEQVISALMEPGFDARKLSYMLSDFARLQMSSVRREALKAELKKKAEQAVKNIEKKATELSPETLAIIREQIYGLTN